MPTLVEQRYEFKGGYPVRETIKDLYDELDLLRALQMYRAFYPTVSGAAIFRGSANVGVAPNKVFGSMDTRPRHIGYTLNSDTPYGVVLLDLHIGPIVIELPPGPLVGAAMDIHQRWILDMGLPGPDAGKAASTCCCPPSTKEKCRRVTAPVLRRRFARSGRCARFHRMEMLPARSSS